MNNSNLPELTPRQQQILHLLRAGKVNKEVARELDIGLGTVKQHIVAIFKKLQVRNRTEAVTRHSDTTNPRESERVHRLILTARPCVVLGMAFTAPANTPEAREFHDLMAAEASLHNAVLLSRQSTEVEVIFGIQAVTEFDVFLAIRAAQKVHATLSAKMPSATAVLRGCLTAGLGFASMNRFGGWSGEAIASAAIAAARELINATPEGRFSSDASVQILGEAFGITGFERLLNGISMNSLNTLQWSGDRPSFPLVGRNTEMRLMRSCIHQARKGKGAVLVIEGEMGMGKSRLCHELISLESELMKNHRWYRVLPPALGSGVFEGTLNRNITELIALAELERSTPENCSVYVLDDAHLINRISLIEWVDKAERAAKRGVLVVLVGRKGLSEVVPRSSRCIKLGRLAPKHMQSLINNTLSLPKGRKRELASRGILEAATGVPLFGIELAKQTDTSRMSLPLLVILNARLDKLHLDNSLLRLCAESPSDLTLTELAHKLDESEAQTAVQLDRAVAAGVLNRNADASYSFNHPMIRKVIATSAME